jgi:hypothetical protein
MRRYLKKHLTQDRLWISKLPKTMAFQESQQFHKLVPMAAFDEALRFGGLVMAHAAYVASDLAKGDLVCPFAIVETGGVREVVTFESDSQVESIERGKASFIDYKDEVTFWAFAREGLLSYVGIAEPKRDVLSVSAWRRGMEDQVILDQCFMRDETGKFKLSGSLMISVHGMISSAEIQATLRKIVFEGVDQHPQGVRWKGWSDL